MANAWVCVLLVASFLDHSSFCTINCEILLNHAVSLKVIDSANEILCSFKTKTIYVYFENETSLSYPEKILKELSRCGISYISLRNKYKVTPLEIINDDGVLMFLVIVILDASQPIDLSIVSKKSAAKHRTHILLIVANSRDITTTWLQQSFRKFWRIWVINVVIIYWQYEQLQIYRYSPFRQQFLIKVNTYGEEHLSGLKELFPQRLPDMHGHPLRFCMYHDEVRAIFDANGALIGGADNLMIQYLTERLNASIIVHLIGAATKNNMSTGICLNEIGSEVDDMALNLHFLDLITFNGHVEYTIIYNRDGLCVLVPKAKTASTFWNIFRSFEVLVWVAILLSLPLAYGFCGLLYRRLFLTEHIFLQLFASNLTMPWTRMPLKFSLRLFLFSWLIYGLLISGAFRGNLTSNLVFHQHLPDINTIQDLALSPYNLLVFAHHTKHLNSFLDNSSFYERMIRQKMRVVSTDVLAQHIDSNNISYAYLQKYHLAKFRANSLRHWSHGRPLYHVMGTCLVPYHAVYFVPYGSPYLGHLNYVIRAAYEFGFNLYWDRMTAINFIKSGRKIIRSQRDGDDDPVVLQLHHFQAAYCLWTIGLLYSALVFLWEIHNTYIRDLKNYLVQMMRHIFVE